MKYCIYCGQKLEGYELVCPNSACGKPIPGQTVQKSHKSSEEEDAELKNRLEQAEENHRNDSIKNNEYISRQTKKKSMIPILMVIVMILVIIVLILAVKQRNNRSASVSQEDGGTVQDANDETVQNDFLYNKNADDVIEPYLEAVNEEMNFSMVGETKYAQFQTNIKDMSLIEWTSGNPSIALVSTDGKITAISSGETTIYAACDGITAEFYVYCHLRDEAEYIIPGSDVRYISREDLDGLSEEELRLARNEIYARKGRLFDDEILQAYFNNKEWYDGHISPSDFSESDLNDYERANAYTIKDYEEEMGYR